MTILMETNHCNIFVFERAHIESAIPLFTSPKVREFLGGTISEDAARNKLEKWINPDSDSMYYSVVLKDGTFIGIIDITSYYGTDTKEISYLFLPEYWGHGYAFETCEKVIAYCKSELHIDKLIAETQKKNTRSRKMLERLGFSLEKEVERFGEIQCVYEFAKNEKISKADK